MLFVAGIACRLDLTSILTQGVRSRTPGAQNRYAEDTTDSDSDQMESDYEHEQGELNSGFRDGNKNSDSESEERHGAEATGQSRTDAMHSQRHGAAQYKTFRTAQWLKRSISRKARDVKQKMHLTERTYVSHLVIFIYLLTCFYFSVRTF